MLMISIASSRDIFMDMLQISKDIAYLVGGLCCMVLLHRLVYLSISNLIV